MDKCPGSDYGLWCFENYGEMYLVGTVGPCESLTEDLTEIQCGNIAFNQKGLNPEAEIPMIRPGIAAPRNVECELG